MLDFGEQNVVRPYIRCSICCCNRLAPKRFLAKATKHYFFILVHTFSIFLVHPSPTFLAHWNQATLEAYKLHLSLSFVAGADAQPRPGRTQRLLQDSRYHYLSPSSVHATAPMQGMFQHFVFRQYCPRHLPGREPEK